MLDKWKIINFALKSISACSNYICLLSCFASTQQLRARCWNVNSRKIKYHVPLCVPCVVCAPLLLDSTNPTYTCPQPTFAQLAATSGPARVCVGSHLCIALCPPVSWLPTSPFSLSYSPLQREYLGRNLI